MDGDTAVRLRERRKREDLIAGLRLESRLQRLNPPSPARAEQERQRRRDRIAALLAKVDDDSPDVSYIDATTEAVLRSELVRLERADPDRPDGDAAVEPAVTVENSNTILYCRSWEPTVRFYRDGLGLPVVVQNDWYVEFRVARALFLSIADSARAPIDHTGGKGITVSWNVVDLAATRERLAARALEPSDIRPVGSAAAFYLVDPEGHRIELWSHDAGR